MRGVQIDPGLVRTGPSRVLWAKVAAAAAGHGLARAGSSTVGVVDYSIGGGVGWLARQYGLAANSTLAANGVTTDARLNRTDCEHEPDQF